LTAIIAFWKFFDRQIDIIKGAFGDRHHQQHQIGPGREGAPFVGDHQADTVVFGPTETLVNHREYFVADGVHLGMKFEAEDTVPQIHQRRAAVLFHLAAVTLQDRKMELLRM